MSLAAALMASVLSVPTVAHGQQDMTAGRHSSTQAPAAVTLQLLGTAGGPGAMVDRAGIASLLTVDGHRYLIDAGDGVTTQLVKAGLNETQIDTIFLTHLHDDHTAGLPALLTFGYTLKPHRVQVIGPVETDALVAGILAYMKPNTEIRMAERHLPDPATLIKGRDFGPSEVYSDGHIKLTAMENTHYHIPADLFAYRDKSYSYRVETSGGKVIVFTGDTGPSPTLAAFAKGADILVSEIVSPQDLASVPPPVVPHMLQEHLSAEQVGRLAQDASAKKVVLSHVRSISPSVLGEIRKFYSGDVVIGNDLDTF